jgi:hypothetical protein
MQTLWTAGFTMLAVLGSAQEPAPPVPPSSAALAGAYALIAPDVAGVPVRTIISQEGDRLLLRVTTADPLDEAQRVRRETKPALEVRVTCSASGVIEKLEVTGSIGDRPRTRVDPTAPPASRARALQALRFGHGADAEIAKAAAARPWRVLGERGAVTSTELVWKKDDHELQPVWRVGVVVDQPTGVASYIATFDAADGSLLGLEKESGR